MRDNYTCQYCFGPARQADHVIPRRKGGADSLDNLVASCVPCNYTAGGRKFLSFTEKRKWLRAKRKLYPLDEDYSPESIASCMDDGTTP